MLIAIDFDETLTKDAALWREFIFSANLRNHRCVCVTARRETAENIDTIEGWLSENKIVVPVFYSSLGSKVEYMERIGQKVDIWIDDDPKRCALGH